MQRAEKPLLGVMLFAMNGRPDYLEIYAPERADGGPPVPFPMAGEIFS